MAETTSEEMVVVPIERIGEEISQQSQIAPSSSHDNGKERVAHKKEEEAHVKKILLCSWVHALSLCSHKNNTILQCVTNICDNTYKYYCRHHHHHHYMIKGYRK